jgi:hypothetical protein
MSSKSVVKARERYVNGPDLGPLNNSGLLSFGERLKG